MKKELEKYFDLLWPLNRSLTGNDNRKTLQILSDIFPINIHETPSGTQCFDWVVPPEWNAKEAWIKDENGNVIVDFKTNNLHLLGYSEPVSGTFGFEELKSHLYTKKSMPDVIPYLTSYYQRRWGFCMSQNQFDTLDPSLKYEVKIDADFNEKGSMSWGEIVIPGNTKKELFFSTYICHPSMGSDVLSGMLANVFLAREIAKMGNLNYTYRFIFIPETIGSVNYLKLHGEHLKTHMEAGYVLTCLGDNGDFTYKKSRQGNARADRMALRILEQQNVPHKIEDFWPGGSDERQFCSPGFNLPVGSLMRSRYEAFPQYHTSADNKSYMDFEALEKGIEMYVKIAHGFETQKVLFSKKPNCEPLLGKRGLYPTLGSQEKYPDYIDAMMWILNLADGQHDLMDVADRSKLPLELLETILASLIEKELVEFFP